MENIFITKIYIDKVRHLNDVDIILSDSERKHLILTGKNGSGKTSLLEAMSDCVLNEQYKFGKNNPYNMWNKHYEKLHELQNKEKPGVFISYSKNNVNLFDVIFAYISAWRNKLDVPKSIEPVDIQGKTVVIRNASKEFLKHVLNLDYQLYGAKSEKNNVLEKKLEKWFDDLKTALRKIYNCEKLELKRDTKKLVFKIALPNREPFGLHEMSDGYAAFIDIYMELLMRLENDDMEVNYEQSAIVMIDEIETHLHVELQKQILPFLTKMFPNVQFIVATHSPFVMTSLENAVVYNLEKGETLEKPSFYSYETVVESFLDTDMYSEKLKNYFERYKELCFKDRTSEENEEFLRAKAELEIMSRPSTELYIAFQELEMKRKAVKNGSIV